MALLGEQVYPKVAKAEKDGYVATAKLIRISSGFMYGFAQQGDALGSLSLKGPGVNVSVGNFFSPVNLTGIGVENGFEQLWQAITSKYNRQIDYGFFRALVIEVLKPYGYFVPSAVV